MRVVTGHGAIKRPGGRRGGAARRGWELPKWINSRGTFCGSSVVGIWSRSGRCRCGGQQTFCGPAPRKSWFEDHEVPLSRVQVLGDVLGWPQSEKIDQILAFRFDGVLLTINAAERSAMSDSFWPSPPYFLRFCPNSRVCARLRGPEPFEPSC